ncbi:hypothetical protein KSP40_PGU017669 [Platanthera guangdongensis]|uniref:Uncharacterized protein n=1 Tax=Platanthera guangdongensis TaxID=2320717 RepID=A0ABR2M977_9ASPA
MDGLLLQSGSIGLHIGIQLLVLLLEEDHLILDEDRFHDLMHKDLLIHIVDLLPHYVGGLHLRHVVDPLHCVEDLRLHCSTGPILQHAVDP